MGDSFERVQEIERVAAARERVRVLSGIMRYNMKRPNDKYFPKWLHILTNREGQGFKPKGEEEWEGRLATIKNEVKMSEQKISQDVNELRKQNDELKKNQMELKESILKVLDLVRVGQKATP